MPYERLQAVQYAAYWWSGYNPVFRAFPGSDGTNFISQCLWAGGIPMEVTGSRDQGWWYLGPNEQWSFSWTVAHSLRWYLDKARWARERISDRELEIGDVISYDWDGDSVWQQHALVVGFDQDGEPLVAAHSVPSWGRHWRYGDSPAYTAQTKYLFWHIVLPG